MTTHTKNHHSNSDLTLLAPSQFPLHIHSPTLTIIQENDTPIECRLTFQITPQLYQQIETQALFNLKPELRGSLDNGNFQPSPNIEIEATLQADLLPHLTEKIANLDEAITYLKNLSQAQPENPLLSTENWFALHVKQPQESGETGYRTFWYYVNPSTLTKENISSAEITEAMLNFFKDWADTNLSNLSDITPNTFSQTFKEMTKAFEELADTTLTATTDTLTEILEDITNTFEELVDIANEDIPEETTSSQEIFGEIVNFFTLDDWAYIKIKGETILRLPFEGENGKWNCYAKAREKQRQFLFYSICPITAPKNKRKTVAEFITRANSGMLIGNFELDFASGEICYKTSLDVSGDLLSFSTIKSLVYPNVRMMDKYLPGIKSVISDKITPEEAILLIESSQVSPPDSNSAPSNNLSDKITPESAIQLIESSQVSPPHSNSAPSNNLTDELPVAIPKSKKKTKSKPSPPTESQPPAEKRVTESDILSRLTQADLLKFEKISQFKSKFEKPMAQSLLEGIKNELINRLGEEGAEIFIQSHQIFAAYNFDGKQIRFIRRYAEFFHLIQVQIEELLTQSSGDEDFDPTIGKLEKLKICTKDRLQQIAKNEIHPQQEIDMLMEITKIREDLALAKHKS